MAGAGVEAAVDELPEELLDDASPEDELPEELPDDELEESELLVEDLELLPDRLSVL
ncbi:hypothetical protein GCM10011575_13980 [Microlunatus endophyticus]|uniref:Uncharacterized protein n=1 Tax=Microlunatus endophyticus TaxID=1716077 RepID=A0A917S599_9ACTN|nr:hypothetical protein GCM10011575_13980 [Microlunatus endophyticus]